MSQLPPPSGALAGGSASAAEKSASSSASPAAAAASASAPKKLRSCVVCRSRKVRCDKQSPCSNCRRANIACVVPSGDRPPKWARRLERITHDAAAAESASGTPAQVNVNPAAGQLMERLRNLESLVQELSGQLEQANAAAAGSAHGSSPGVNSPGNSTHERNAGHQASSSPGSSGAGMRQHFGRLVLQDTSRSRYVGSGFWSRVSDELDGLKMDARGLASGGSDSSEDDDSPGKAPSITQELERTPSERHAFLFRHNLGGSTPDLRAFRPLPSQIPFLLDIYSENVNVFVQMVHMPTVKKLAREMRRSDSPSLTPANEALMFAIYYAAVTSMEEDDVMTNFDSKKADMNLKFRLGLEYALAKADFLNVTDIVLVQAFAVFLYLVRRHDSPRFVWMMTGLVIRMAQAIGLHRDGSHFKNLSPYEVEMRRRIWWGLCLLDVRASEDQGTDFLIANGTFDTKLPLNVDDADINPDTKEFPRDREGMTDISISLASFEICYTTRQMMAPGGKDGGLSFDEQTLLLDNLYERLERKYLQYSTESYNMAHWVGVTATRLVICKLILLIYLPALFSSPSERFSDGIRNKLLVAAIELAEYNHVLNAEKESRQWRWIYQVYTHWHAIVYLLIEVCRRQWSPIVERAWIALHSSWLIPVQTPNMDKNLRIWVPLRKLMAKARRRREAELERIQGNMSVIEQLELSDRNIPAPASSGPFRTENSEQLFREHWRSIVSAPGRGNQPSASSGVNASLTPDVLQGTDTSQQLATSSTRPQTGAWSNPDPSTISTPNLVMASYSNPTSTIPSDWTGGQPMGSGFTPWLSSGTDPTMDVFADVDVNMDMDVDVDWNNWLESATGVGWEARPEGNGG